MKVKIMNVGIVLILLAMSLTSCNNDCEKKLVVLQKSYDSLINVQNKFGGISEKVDLALAQPLDSIKQGNIFYNNFLNSPNITIPSSWRFQKTDFQSILSKNPEYVTLYPIINKDNELSIMAVGTDASNNDILTDDAGAIMVFDFSKICPEDCSNANALNTVSPLSKPFKKHKFKKTGGTY